MQTLILEEFCKVLSNSTQKSHLGNQDIHTDFDLRAIASGMMLLIGVAICVEPKITRRQRMFFLSGLSVYAARLNTPKTLLHNQTTNRGEQNAFPSKTRATNRRKRDLFL